MAHCVWCGRGGIFLRLDKNRLCRTCAARIYRDIKTTADRVLRCYARLKDTPVLRVKLRLAAELMADIDKMKAYESRGLPIPAIDLDLTGVFANTTNASLVDVTVDAHRDEDEALKTAMDEYNAKVGQLPKEIYSMPVAEVAAYLKGKMKGE